MKKKNTSRRVTPQRAISKKVSPFNINRTVTLVGPVETAQAGSDDIAIAGDGGLAQGIDGSICIAGQYARAFTGAGGMAFSGPKSFSSANSYGAAFNSGEGRAAVNQYGVALALGIGYAIGDRSSVAMVTDGLAQTANGGIATACTPGGIALGTGRCVLIATEDDVYLCGGDGSVLVGITAQSAAAAVVAMVGAGGLAADTYYKYSQGQFTLIAGDELATVQQTVKDIQSRPLPSVSRNPRKRPPTSNH